MSQLTFAEPISRVRDRLKATHQDNFLTDRMIYAMYRPWLTQVMKELDVKNRLMAFNALFQTLEMVPLEEVDKVEAGCTGLKSGFTFMKTKDPVGELFMEGYWGGMIRSVTSLDLSVEFQPISPAGFTNIANSPGYKFNSTKYYWYLNDFLYFPNIAFRAVRIEAITEGDISKYKCNPDEKCLVKQDQSFNIPDYVQSRVESLLFQSLGISLQLPEDPTIDNRSTILK